MNNFKRRHIIILLGALTTLGPFSTDMYLPGFAAIAFDLNSPIAHVGLSLTSYFIGICLGQLIYGPLLDRYGRKKPLITGLVLYIAVAILCGVAPSVASLIALRFMLALGVCVCIVASRAVVNDLFPHSEMAKILSYLVVITGISPLLAPSVGGAITTYLGWRCIFFVLALIAIIMLLAVIKSLPESKRPDKSVSLKLNNVLAGYNDVITESRFLIFTVAGGFAYAGMFAYIAGAPFVFMELFGMNEGQFSIIFTINVCGFILGSQINSLLLRKYKAYNIAFLGSYLLVAAAILMFIHFLLGLLNAVILVVFLFLFLFLIGFIFPNVTAIALAPFYNNAGRASALLGCLQMISGVTATVLVNVFADGTLKPMIVVMLGSAFICMALISYYEYNLKDKITISDTATN